MLKSPLICQQRGEFFCRCVPSYALVSPEGEGEPVDQGRELGMTSATERRLVRAVHTTTSPISATWSRRGTVRPGQLLSYTVRSQQPRQRSEEHGKGIEQSRVVGWNGNAHHVLLEESWDDFSCTCVQICFFGDSQAPHLSTIHSQAVEVKECHSLDGKGYQRGKRRDITFPLSLRSHTIKILLFLIAQRRVR